MKLPTHIDGQDDMTPIYNAIEAAGFTVREPHTCAHTGLPMCAFYAADDQYRETAVYLELETGNVEIDIATNCEFYGNPFFGDFSDVLRSAAEEI